MKSVDERQDHVHADGARARDVLEQLELTQSQGKNPLGTGPGRPLVPMRELARKLHFDPSNITLMTDRLAAAGLVERRPHPTDRRPRVLALTDRAAKSWRCSSRDCRNGRRSSPCRRRN